MTPDTAVPQQGGSTGGGRGKGRGAGGRGRGRGGRGRGGGGRGSGLKDDSKSLSNDSKPNTGEDREAPKINTKPNTQTANAPGVGAGKNRRRNNQNKGKKGDKQPPPSRQQEVNVSKGTTDEERRRNEEDRLKEEAEEKERKRLEEEEEKARQAQQEARDAGQTELNARFREAVDYLKEVSEAVESHKESRKTFSPEELNAARKSFEATKKNLKSDLKKCTTFVKKIKTGGAWSVKPSDIVKDVSTLNLSRYVEEVVTSILEAKMKLTDLPVVLALCKAMHERYSTFLPALLPGLWSTIHSKPTEETAKLRRVYVRLLTEFVLNGLSSETKQLVKLITDVSGGKDGNYNVTDAHVLLAFVKSAGFEILDTMPTLIRTNADLIRQEVVKTTEIRVEKTERNLQVPIVVPKDLAQKGTNAVEIMEGLLNERAVSNDISKLFYTHCKGAYGTLCKSLVSTDSKLKKMEMRCEQDRLLAGSLTESREKGLQEARNLRETLWKSVETMSDILDLPMPRLEEHLEDDIGERTGVELWTKGGDDYAGIDYGPFDDEETRAFYCDIPDFLTTIPPALLGLNDDEIDKRKAENLIKYGSDFGVETSNDDDETNEVAPSSEAELEAAEKEEGRDKEGDATETSMTGETKDTPHYKLMVLLEQELPECNRREKIDELSEKFCTNHGSSKNSRKRLSQTLFLVPRARLDLLPYYSRMAATLSRVWSDIGSSLLVELEQQFHGQAKFKKNQNIESRLRTAQYIGELTKFRLAPPIISLRCLRRCLDDLNGGNVDVACVLLESCGRYLYRLPHTNEKLAELMEVMIRLSKAKRLDERSLALINTALYTVKPPASGPKKRVKEYTPLEGYLRHLLLVSLQPTEDSITAVAKQLYRFPWDNPAMQCSTLVGKMMLKACRIGRYRSIHAVANVAAKLRRQKPEFYVRFLDLIIEELEWSLEHPSFRDQQRTLTVARLLGELCCASVAPAPLIFQQLYLFINVGHEIPPTLREASRSIVEDMSPVYNSASGVSQPIKEDEEMGDPHLKPKEDVRQPVAVSMQSKHDPRVPSALDPPNSVFRIKLVCALLEVAAKSMVTKNNLPKISAFLAAFQRYLFTKAILPTEVEFALLDTFDILDSEWRKIPRDPKKKGQDGTDESQGFPRYDSWLLAHNATVANEEAEATTEARSHARLIAQAGNGQIDSEVITIASDSYNDDDDVLDDDDDYESVDAMSLDSLADDSDHISGDEGIPSNNPNDHEGSQESVTAEGESSDEDDDDDTDDTEVGSEDEFDEDAYMQQLEAEAFEAELRRLTMDALEKGKSGLRGGQVSDSMPTGSQFLKKKPVDMSEADGPTIALGGKEGISFSLLKKGNKGKMEAKQFYVPKDTNLAAVATKQDDEAARERDMIKARVLQYEAEAAEAEAAGGSLYLEQEKLTVIRNRPLLMDEIDKNFGTSGGNLPNPPGRRSAGGSHAQGGGQGGRPITYLQGARGRGSMSGRSGRGRGRGSSGRGLI
ncbi:MIF4G domain containing protein [Nitzschia inconspicua]|uniref:MIF4G domain containing protein n=1 Tax=Nitzschia inconspicua TaxID=303405 RepID=A0A9K3KDX7_9STRA|nr:MIF4G domain containing protein [Nitzschia inconspicua]